MLTPSRASHREYVTPLASPSGTAEYLPVSRTDTKNEKGAFVYRTQVGVKVWDYLTNDPATRITTENWKDNFSAFFTLRNHHKDFVGLIGFSVQGISLFEEGFTSRRDISLERESGEYHKLSKIEKKVQSSGAIEPEDADYLFSLWQKYADPQLGSSNH